MCTAISDNNVSRKRIELTSLASINFSIFRRTSLVKSYFAATRYTKIHIKFIHRKVRSSLEEIDFFKVELNFPRNMQIFKED